MDLVSVIHESKTAIFSTLPQDDSSVEDLLLIDDNSVVQNEKMMRLKN